MTINSPITTRAECPKDSKGIATKASAKGKINPNIIWPSMGIHFLIPTTSTVCTVPPAVREWRKALKSAAIISRMKARAASTHARVSRKGERNPSHADSQLVIQGADDRKHMSKPQGFHHKNSQKYFHQMITRAANSETL